MTSVPQKSFLPPTLIFHSRCSTSANLASQNPKAKTKSDDLFQNTNGLGGPPAWLKTYDNLFRALYSIEVEFSDESLDEFLTDATCLLQAAENLGAEKSISRVLETHLLRAGQPFWHTVRDDPGKWTDVATRIESPVIYREAMIHLVGAWNMVPDSIDNPIDKEAIRSYKGGAIIEAAVLAKIKGQTEEKRCIEKSLVEHFPPAMIHQTVQVVNKAGKAVQKPPTRQNYAEDIYLWQALCLVRMYITTEIRHNGSFREIDGGASFFRSIAAGGNAYLQPQTIENYFNMMHMTERGKICLCNALYDLKNAMKHIVAPLVVNNSCVLQDDGKPMQHEYLTHTTISDKELPWNVKPAGENPMEAEMNRDNMIIVGNEDIEPDA